MTEPLVTFALFSYNQERFVREAVRGALAQTYSPLQVVISDDCSQDRTFEIIEEEVAGYEGPHQVLLNRNPRNLGIGGHVNRVMELAKGELIVTAAADDVSLPTRTEELARVWSKGEVFGVWSAAYVIDPDGSVIGKVPVRPTGSWLEIVHHEPYNGPHGATSAWDRAVVDVFGSLPAGSLHEDYIFALRSALLGEIAWIDKCLIKYRIDAGMRTKLDLSQYIRYHSQIARAYAVEYEGWLRDIRLFLENNPKIRAEAFQAMETIKARMSLYELKATAAESSRIDRLRSFIRVAKNAKKLTIEHVIKALLLSIWPTTYYRAQQWWREKLKVEIQGRKELHGRKVTESLRDNTDASI